MYDLGIKKSTHFNFPVICVGNLSVGGTGKTPMIEYLIRLLKDEKYVATLSRGYRRKTEGFKLADATDSAESIGDEPFQFYNKFGDSVLVAVDAHRVNGINKLQALTKAPDVILLDDAFQHRKVKAGLNILLTTYSNPFFCDLVLPTGDLREPKVGAKRANIIVVTKCPTNLNHSDKAFFIRNMNLKPFQTVFFSSIVYSNTLVSVSKTLNLDELNRFTLITGIANASTLVDFLKSKDLQFEHLNFGDHHDFTQDEIKAFEAKELIVTTEKDFMRLKQYDSLSEKLFYLPITVLISEPEKFNKLILDFVES